MKNIIFTENGNCLDFQNYDDTSEQWHGGSEVAGGWEAALLMAPPVSHTFLPLGLGRVSCRRCNMQ